MEEDRQWLSCAVLFWALFSLCCSSESSHTGAGARQSRKRRSNLTAVCPALCALRLGDPSHSANAPLLPSFLQLVYGGRYFYLCNDLPDAALWRRLSFLWLCLYPPLSEKGREVMEVGGGCCCCWWWWFGCSHWFVSLLCLSLALHLFPALSLFTSLQFTSHNTHTYTPRFGQITQGWGTEGRRCQFVSSPEQALPPNLNCHRKHRTSASISKLPKTHFTIQFIKCVRQQNLNIFLGSST